MARKRLKKRSASLTTIAADGPQLMKLVEYEVTDEPIHNRAYSKLPGKVRDRIDEMHWLAQTEPYVAIPELEQLIERYPQIPTLYNYLSAAYIKAGEMAKGEAVIRANYEQNPDYLFARINYAQLFLYRQEYEKVAEIFDHKLDLSLLYPNRRRFHTSEFMGFMGVVGLYYIGIDERDLAENIYKVMKDAGPTHVLTRQLGQALNPGVITRLLKWLARK